MKANSLPSLKIIAAVSACLLIGCAAGCSGGRSASGGLSAARGGLEQWTSVSLAGRKMGWEHYRLSRDAATRQLVLSYELHCFDAGKETYTQKVRASFRDDETLWLTGFEMDEGDGLAERVSLSNGVLVKEVRGAKPAEAKVPESAIFSHGLWVWAAAGRLEVGARRTMAKLEEGFLGVEPQSMLSVEALEKVRLGGKEVKAYKITGGGLTFWVDADRRVVQTNYGGPVCTWEPDEKSAKAGLGK